MNEIISRQDYVLSAICERLNDMEIAAVYRHKGEDDVPMNIVSCMIDEYGLLGDDVLGEFFFTPQESCPEEVQYFNCVITLMEEFSEDSIYDLCAAVALVNFYLQFGSFSIELANRQLVYKLSVPLPSDLDKEQLLKQADMLAAQGMNMGERYADRFTKLSNGDISIDEFLV